MSILRLFSSVVAVAMGAALGGVSFVVAVLADWDRGAMNDVFAADLGVAYLLPAVGVMLISTVLATVLVARYSLPFAKLLGLSGVAVFGLLLLAAAALASYAAFAVVGVAVAVTGTAFVLLAVKAMQRGAV